MKRLFLAGLCVGLLGCTVEKHMVWQKPGVIIADFQRDKYTCVQQSRTSYSGGGGGVIGILMILDAQQRAKSEAEKLFTLCMEAHGYSIKEL